MIELWTFVGFALWYSYAKRVLVFTVHARNGSEAQVLYRLYQFRRLLVVSDELLRDDDQSNGFKIRRVDSNNTTSKPFELFSLE
jgi:hypothetical protein